MAELFIELFSEEIPGKLQIDARQKIREIINEKLKKKEARNSLIETWANLFQHLKDLFLL